MSDKVQMNVYVPQDIKDYVAEVSEKCGVNQSEFIHLILLQSKSTLDLDKIKEMAVNMKVYGEPSLREE